MASDRTESITPPGMWCSAGSEGSSPIKHTATSSAGRLHSDRQTNDSGPASRSAVAVACQACRSRHLKCDGLQQCSRCLAENLHCSYIKSRRGWKGPRSKSLVTASYPPTLSISTPASAQPLLSLSPQIDVVALEQAGLPTYNGTMIAATGRTPCNYTSNASHTAQVALIPPPAAKLSLDTSDAGLIEAYYLYFFPGHPFVLPRGQLSQYANHSNVSILHLAMQYMGAFYVIGLEPTHFEAALRSQILNHAGSKDAFLVQAMLIYAIGLHTSNKCDESTSIMYRAIQHALDIGMDQSDFATRHAGDNTFMIESLRRTWWEIYVVDAFFSGVKALFGYRSPLGDMEAMVPLPIDDREYFSGIYLSPPQTMQDLNDQVFLPEDVMFSSGAYRVAAAQVVHKCLIATAPDSTDEDAMTADNMLENWKQELPEHKKKIIDHEGVIDEVLFEAHMIILACTIILHTPRSDLSKDEVKDVTNCISRSAAELASNMREVHTAKTMFAARDICVLIKLPCPLVRHSPFFTCAITMSAVSYLAYWCFVATESGDHMIKEYIRLNIGSLKSLSSKMPIANTVLGQVRHTAQELFHSKKAISHSYWSATTREQIIQSMIEEVSAGTITASPTSYPSGWEVGYPTHSQQ